MIFLLLSRLASLCDSLHTDLDKHMGIIRASLRQFREKQETTLGRLRDSNAEFIKSVRYIHFYVLCFLSEKMVTFKPTKKMLANQLKSNFYYLSDIPYRGEFILALLVVICFFFF